MSQLFAGMFARGSAAAELSDGALVQALLDVEIALGRALARVQIVPLSAAEALAAAASPELLSLAKLAEGSAAAGNPMPALLAQLRESLPPSAAQALHFGATSQDVIDSALVLVAKRTVRHVLADLGAAADATAWLAREHRTTLMLGRTLLQPAVPVTFGLKAAGWLWSLDDARQRLARVSAGLPVQLGGAAGTLALLGDRGPQVVQLLAAELKLVEPVLPWHSLRAPLLELAAACGLGAAALGKIARDVSLLAQLEVGELREAGGGASSTMPHKQNPVASIAILSCTRRVPSLVATLLAAAEQEHERGAGGWHAEWETLIELLGLLGSAASWLRTLLENVVVDSARMQRNLDATGGVVLAERVGAWLAQRVGKPAADAALQAALGRTREQGLHLRESLLADGSLQLTAAELAGLFDASGYLGSSARFIERALAAHEASR